MGIFGTEKPGTDNEAKVSAPPPPFLIPQFPFALCVSVSKTITYAGGAPEMDTSQHLLHLPQDTLHQIFASLPLRQIVICRAVCKSLRQTLTSPSFLHHLSSSPTSSLHPPLRFISLRPHHPHHHHHHHHVSPPPFLHVYNSDVHRWLRLPLDFLPFPSPPLPITSSPSGLLFLWAHTDSANPVNSANSVTNSLSLVVCNPLTRSYKILPSLGSAWSRHGTVLVDSSSPARVLVLTQIASLFFSGSGSGSWLKFSSNLPSKPRSPILVANTVFALCDVGSPWRSQWKMFSCALSQLGRWNRLERHEWGDVFDILKRPRLIQGCGNRVLMVGGLKSSFSLNASCSTILILRLDLETLEWEEAGRMPGEMFRCFQESSKFKVFGGGDRVCFSARRLRRLAIWDCSVAATEAPAGGKGEWRWIDGVPGSGDGLCRGFLYEARLTPVI